MRKVTAWIEMAARAQLAARAATPREQSAARGEKAEVLDLGSLRCFGNRPGGVFLKHKRGANGEERKGMKKRGGEEERKRRGRKRRGRRRRKKKVLAKHIERLVIAKPKVLRAKSYNPKGHVRISQQ